MSIGARLKAERVRLGLSQPELAAIGGVSKNTQVAYEKDASHPDAAYLAATAKAGIDFIYVVTGRRLEELSHDLPSTDMEVLSYWRKLSETDRTIFIQLLGRLSRIKNGDN